MRRLLVRRLAAAAIAAVLLAAAGVPAQAITFKDDPKGQLAVPDASDCPTTSRPGPYETWFNIPDAERRGYVDLQNQTPWDFATKIAQVICAAAPNSTIEMSQFFIRALGTMTSTGLGPRPESDPEVVYDALDWVHKNRNVDVGLVLHGGRIHPKDIRALIKKRLAATTGPVHYCYTGCFNSNDYGPFPWAVNHDKFIAISDTTWSNDAPGPHPLVVSMSGQFARSQIRNFAQEVTLVYDDQSMYDIFSLRYAGMAYCADTGCRSSKGFPKGLQLKSERKIWVDPIYRHYTDPGRGTTVSFTPQSVTSTDFYIQQFDDVDCAVDKKIRIAMFKITDSKAERMAESLSRLRKRGCDIKLLLTYEGGTQLISKKVVKTLKKSKIPLRCTLSAMHTKLILIGPEHGAGRILVGTQNMSTAGLRYNEDHVVTFDTRRANDEYLEPMRKLYGQYMEGWYELSQSTRSCG